VRRQLSTSRAAAGLLAAAAAFAASAALAAPARAASVPVGLVESTVVSGLSSPTALALAPDGRIFVTQQGGSIRVIENGILLPTPFASVTVSSAGERGLLGVALDPGFAGNGWVYVYYTATTPTTHNRVSRFTAAGNVAAAGSETVILELDDLSTATNHNGGALHFGPDGKLYVAVGDNANGANAQSLSTLHGKMLRINKDGTIPSDNPFYAAPADKYDAVWALGLRNPYTFAFDPASTRMFLNDVGQNTWEEVNDGIAGSNYGWPATEGPTTNPAYRAPLHYYGHGTSDSTGCAITGAAFYAPERVQLPPDYRGDYYFGDFCSGWIRRLDPSSPATSTLVATGIVDPVDLAVAPDGALLYLARGGTGSDGSLSRIETLATWRRRSFAADLDGDGKDEVTAWRPSTGTWWTRGGATFGWGLPLDVPVPGDYDADAEDDRAVWRPSTGQWWVAGSQPLSWGLAGDVPVPGDYDGDGKTDEAVWRRSTGQWWVVGQPPQSWGVPGDVPVPGDYDADPQDDLAVWRPSTGQWWVLGSQPVVWGFPGDIPVPADYDGDGKTDIATWRPSTGTWWVRGGLTLGWGLPNDIPVPGDFDADPADDVAVWRPSTGTWWIHGSAPLQWGFAEDVP
jgi:glucose/arabinose dehydrogenase